MPVAALLLGALIEQVADRQHVNVLAFPLLGIIAWNLVVYVLLMLRALGGRAPRRLRHWLAELPRTVRPESAAAAAIAAALPATGGRAAGLLDARAGRVLHFSAALFAIGALLGLYVRALAFEYRIGWESTFLQAPAVHAFLATLLGPAAKLLGMPFPSVDAIEAMRITGGRAAAMPDRGSICTR